MTAIQDPRAAVSPPAQRLRAPSWRDGRLLVGVVLLLLSVVVGARLLDSSSSTISVLVAARELPAGHVLVSGDLGDTAVRLDAATSGSYYAESVGPQLLGRALTRPVGRGELLPAGAVSSGTAATDQVVALSVESGRLPALHAGDRIDVYATQPVKSPTGDTTCTTLLVGSGLEVVDDVDPADASGSVAVTVHASAELAPVLVHAAESSTLDVVRDATGVPAPSSSPPQPLQSLGSLASGSCVTGH